MFSDGTLPSWTIYGAKIQGVCCVWASDSLTSIQIQSELRNYSWYGAPGITITIECHGYSVAQGATWQEAMANLFGGGEWNPDRRGQQRAITEGQRAVGPGQVSIPSDAEIIDAMEHDENKYY